MSKKYRLDWILAHMGHGSRKEIRKMIKAGRVTVNENTVFDPAQKINTDTEKIRVDDEPVFFKRHIYLMFNKPAGCVSATVDNREKTVIELLSEKDRIFMPFPVGRLDKDTEGLLIITNDGSFAHNITSPRKKIKKTYYAEINGFISTKDQEIFRAGVELDDGYITLPAELDIISSNLNSKVRVSIVEGKYHQVKRIFRAVGKEVTYLKRLCIGNVELDESLKPGEYRELKKQELDFLFSADKEELQENTMVGKKK